MLYLQLTLKQCKYLHSLLHNNFSGVCGVQDPQGQDVVGTGSLKSHGSGSTVTKHNHISFADSADNSKHGVVAECNNEIKTIDIFDELENDALLDVKLLNRWDYPIFDFAARAPDTILCRVSVR